jgi:hypothetical protein
MKKTVPKTIFTDPETAQLISHEYLNTSSVSFKTVLSKKHQNQNNIFYARELPASISDMFYVQPMLLHNQYYMGGVIDLVPIELARHLPKK